MKKPPSKRPVKKTDVTAPRVVGRVTAKERDEIQKLYERKNGLNELVVMFQQNGGLENNKALYEKLVADMGQTTTAMQKWWSDKSKAYAWENIPGGHWSIDFDTCEIVLNA